jgi:hypothetical protein
VPFRQLVSMVPLSSSWSTDRRHGLGLAMKRM